MQRELLGPTHAAIFADPSDTRAVIEAQGRPIPVRAVLSGRPMRQVATGGLRNERPLTAAERSESLQYAVSLGLDPGSVHFLDNTNTSFKVFAGVDVLIVGTDVLPAAVPTTANSRVTLRGAIAHEVVGHRAAEIAGKTQPLEYLEEAQASLRAAELAPELTDEERRTLRQDAAERLPPGMTLANVRATLWLDP